MSAELQGEAIRAAARELSGMTLQAVQHIIDHRLYHQMGIPQIAVPLIESSWESRQPSLCGRLDFTSDRDRPPKLLEYEADVPSDLPESDEVRRLLIARWGEIADRFPGGRVDFAYLESNRTVAILRETAQQAGLAASCFPIAEIGWNGREFVGPDERPLPAVFKMYPWECMMRDEFGRHLAAAQTIWVEPPWRMLLSSKGILAVLWKLFPRHPNLLESSFDSPGLMMSWVRKPLFGRGGANMTIHQPGHEVTTEGPYGAEGFVYQEMSGLTPVVSAWMIGSAAAAITPDN